MLLAKGATGINGGAALCLSIGWFWLCPSQPPFRDEGVPAPSGIRQKNEDANLCLFLCATLVSLW